MISMNLLPDSKMVRLKNQRRQRTLSAISVLAIGLGVGLPLLLIILWLGQKGLIALTQNSIDDKITELRSIENLDKMLTTQSQLESLPEVEKNRLYYTTLTNLLPKILPPTTSLNSIEMGEGNLIHLRGTADSVASINDLVNIIDNTDLVGSDKSTKELFTNVVLLEIQPTDEGASFEISAAFDPVLLAKSLGGEVRVGDKVIIPFTFEETTGADNTGQPADSTQLETEGVFGETQPPEEAQP